jgi:hypothetical protein
VIDLHDIALPDTEADRATDIVENGLGARRDVVETPVGGSELAPRPPLTPARDATRLDFTGTFSAHSVRARTRSNPAKWALGVHRLPPIALRRTLINLDFLAGPALAT